MSTDDILECGRPIDDVWDHLDRPPTEHEQSCTYCIEARRRFTRLRDLTEQAREADEKHEISPELAQRVVDFARSHVRRGKPVPVYRTPTTDLSFSEYVFLSTIRRVVDSYTGVLARRSRIHVDENPEGGRTRMSIRVSLVVDPRIWRSGYDEQLRSALIHTFASELGVELTSVDLVLEDLHYDA
ncbi:hypothetical protein [Citricoccus sp. NR2]|uniref:hypothetical protein n=1 Tax=Citricoccus sp. NR2 TaxID=3004095 RepID=UPI0022DD19B8|nr:hypothetical protein [Citricoccus sp. NR2]WBL19953.1 hypothetical protein O1A05_04495 [Citricoccus sp. NR2]